MLHVRWVPVGAVLQIPGKCRFVLREGTLQQVATPLELYRAPANRFVADFIGESNLLAGTVVSPTAVDCSALQLTINSPSGKSKVHLLLRPEAIRIATPDDAPANRIAATVIERIFLGNAYRYRVQTDGGLELLARISSASRARLPEPGERAEFGWDAEDVHLIEAQ